MNLPVFFQSLLSAHALPAFFVFTLLYSFSLPISEEIALLLVGVAAHHTDKPLALVMLVAYPGIFGSDLGYYWIARRFGGRLLRSRFFGKLIHPKKVAVSELYFRNRGPKIAFFCRFIVGVRAPAMIAAGILRMPFRLFALYDGLGAVISTCLWLSLGYFWSGVVSSRLTTMGAALAIATPLLIVIALTLAYRRIKRSYLDTCAVEARNGEPEQEKEAI